MGRARVVKIVLDGHGSFLGMEKGCFVVRDKHGEAERFPLFENKVGEVVLRSGNAVSTGALASLRFWGVDVLVLTQRGRPVAMLRSLDDDSHVRTRVCQYEALENGKGVEIAKQIVFGKVESQNRLLIKYGLRQHDLMRIKERIDSIEGDSLKAVRRRLVAIEGRCAVRYFGQVFGLFPKAVRVESRKTFKAYEGLNNVFNLGYAVLKWKVHVALVRAKLEPFLGFLHSEQFGKPSLVCDFVELYRCVVDDFLIGFCKGFEAKDFVVKRESFSSRQKGKREYLSKALTWDLIKGLYEVFGLKVDVPRIKQGRRQRIDTLICEEALLFAKFLRGERKEWLPRIAVP